MKAIIPDPSKEPTPIIDEESPKGHSPGAGQRVIYKADDSFDSDFSIVSCAEGLLSILDHYGVPFDSRPVVTYKYDEASQSGIFGDPNGPHLEFNIYDGRNKPSDGYSGDLGGMSLCSSQLLDRLTGEKLEISIRIEFLAWSSNQIHIQIEGEFDAVEQLKAALEPFLGK